MSNNETAKELFFKGLDCLDSNDFAKAEAFFVRTLQLANGHISALNNLAVAQFRQGKFGEAALTTREIIILDAGNLPAYAMLSNCQIEQREFEAALATCETIISIDPTDAETHSKSGFILGVTGKNQEALAAYEKALALKPDLYQAWLGCGDLLTGLKRYQDAVAAYDKALAANPDLPAAWLGRGDALAVLMRHDQAMTAYQSALELNPALVAAWLGSAHMLAALRRFDEALRAYEKLLELAPDLAEAWAGRADILGELKRSQEALQAYDKAVALKPELASAWNSRGDLLSNLGRRDEAMAAYDKALAVTPDMAPAWLGRGNILSAVERYEEALEAYDKILLLEPILAEAWLCRANAFFGLNRHDDALADYNKALALKPGLAEALRGRGDVLFALDRHEEAIIDYEAALSIKPHLAEALVGRGNVLFRLDRLDEAMAAFDEALARKPDLANAHLGRGYLLYSREDFDQATAAYDAALALNPDLAEAWLGHGNIAYFQKRFDEAFSACDRAFSLKPDLVGIEGARLYAKMLVCDWHNFNEECRRLISSVRGGRVRAHPPALVGLPAASAEDQLKCAALWTSKYYPSSTPDWRRDRYKHEKLRLAYLSADFGDHPVSYLMAGVFEQHDRTRFETTAISFGPDDGGKMRTRLEGIFDRFIDVKNQSDKDVAQLLRTMEIDIAVDLMGHTARCRPAILANRAAPVQVNYLGYAGTMGANFMDYLVADPTLIPSTYRSNYLEKIAYLPNSYLPNDDANRTISDRVFKRSDLGLPPNGIVFCCFNNAFKLNPDVFDSWAKILNALAGSVLWLSPAHPAAIANLKKEIGRRGIDPNRLIFADRVESSADHLARHRLADLFLDTLPYNAHTTASDALWAGLPVLTLIGDTFAGRVAASLLTALDLPELITHSRAEYEKTAIDLATDPARLALARDKLSRNRVSTPLFNTRVFTRDIEAIYEAMHARFQAGLPPDHIQL